MRPFLTRWAVTTLAVAVASRVIPGIHAPELLPLLSASLLLGIANAFLRPVLLLLSLPLILVTLGFFVLVVNALLLRMVSGLVPGFQVDNFGAAFFGALVISVVSWPLSAFFRASDGKVHTISHHPQVREPRMKQAPGRVIE